MNCHKSIFLLLLLLPVLLPAQKPDTSQLVKYTRDFDFRKGIYLSFENFKDNDPLHSSRIISEFSPEPYGFFKKVVTQEKLRYLNEANDTVCIPAQSVWGYSDEDGIYILPKKYITQMNQNMPIQIQNNIQPYKLITIGSISSYYEIDSSVVYTPSPVPGSYPSQIPYGPVGNTFSIRPASGLASQSRIKKKLVPHVLDYNTGLVHLFDIDVFEEKLKQEDPDLYKEYKKEKGNKQRKAWLFIFRYNEKHPIYFPG